MAAHTRLGLLVAVDHPPLLLATGLDCQSVPSAWMWARTCSKEHPQLQFRPPTYPPPMRAHSGHNLFRHSCLSPTTSGPPEPKCFNNTSVTYANLGGPSMTVGLPAPPPAEETLLPIQLTPSPAPHKACRLARGESINSAAPKSTSLCLPFENIFTTIYITRLPW